MVEGNDAVQRLNLVGAGRVGKTLARLWHLHGQLQIQDVLTTSPASAAAAIEFIGAGHVVSSLADMRPADLWLIATPDAQIADMARQLAEVQARLRGSHAGPEELGGRALCSVSPARFAGSSLTYAEHPATQLPSPSSPLVFHGSGALGSDLLAPLRDLGWRTASAHCILSFATPQVAVNQFTGTACALEGDPVACTTLRAAFTAIGARCFEVASADKLLYHAAAVFATNFLPVLQSVAEDLWRSTGVPPALIPDLRASLLHNAVANITALGPQGALTGPAARGDVAAIARQGAAVSAWSGDAGAAYAALSALALQMAQARRQNTGNDKT
jgi:predicted short-subunit dehydrogenase-like oxidoreductase (DUF2520 family)